MNMKGIARRREKRRTLAAFPFHNHRGRKGTAMKKDIEELLSAAEEQHREEWRLRLALLKESTAYRAFWDELGHRGPDLSGDERARFNGLLREKFGIELDLFRRHEWFNRLDPYRLNDQAIVRFHYPLPAIMQVTEPGIPDEHRCETFPPSEERGNELKPSERLLRVDLSRKRSELLREFTLFLDLAEAHRESGDVPEDWKQNFSTWEPDTSRFRSEAWQALEVWRLRRKRKTYKDIARTLKIGLQAAKMAFRRAYELIEGKPYRPEAFKRENLPVSTSELGKTCSTCPIRSTCKELCPDMLVFIDQDYGSQREVTSDAIDLFNLGQQRSRKDNAE